MIKIKTKFDIDKGTFDWKFNSKKTNTIEHLCIIWKLMENILENDEYLNEKDLLKMLKDRKKYMDEMEEK